VGSFALPLVEEVQEKATRFRVRMTWNDSSRLDIDAMPSALRTPPIALCLRKCGCSIDTAF
jgi:hypothetical protein